MSGISAGGEPQRDRISLKGVLIRCSKLSPQMKDMAWRSGQLAIRPWERPLRALRTGNQWAGSRRTRRSIWLCANESVGWLVCA
eukprot:1886614-Prorocentrum_lima.AAC.1